MNFLYLFVFAIVRASVSQNDFGYDFRGNPNKAVHSHEDGRKKKKNLLCAGIFVTIEAKKKSNTPLLIYGQPIENFSLAWGADTENERKNCI